MRSIFLLTLFLFLQLIGNTTVINCNNTDYAGKKLEFRTHVDPISLESEILFTLEFDKNGKCSKTIKNNKTLYSFCDFGVYRGMLFLEPNKNITIKLPPIREKSFSDKKNPFFNPVAFWFATESKEQLNSKVLDFTKQFNLLTDKFFNQLYFRQSKEIYDSIVFLLDKNFGNITSKAFQQHKNLKLKLVEVDVFRQKPTDYSSMFSAVNSEFWTYPTFVSLFEKTFNNQLSFEAKALKGEKVKNAVNRGELLFLLKHMKSKYKIEGKMAELALLKMLYDAHYSGDFSRKSISKMVNNSLFTKNSNQIIREASKRISKKFTHLQRETPAPPICLENFKGEATCTNRTKDKFKYIVFADTEMIVCREHLKFLENIQQRFQKHLEIFVIHKKTDVNNIKKFLDDFNISGTQLLDGNNKFIEKYNIKSFPQCFLLDENHKIEISSAKAPLDGFEQQFGAFLQRELFERQRNQHR